MNSHQLFEILLFWPYLSYFKSDLYHVKSIVGLLNIQYSLTSQLGYQLPPASLQELQQIALILVFWPFPIHFKLDFATLGLPLGFSAKLRIWQDPACKMEPRSDITGCSLGTVNCNVPFIFIQSLFWLNFCYFCHLYIGRFCN